MASLNISGYVDLDNLPPDLPKCKKLKQDITGWKIGFVLEENKFGELYYATIPVLIELLIKKGTRTTTQTQRISDADLLHPFVLTSQGLLSQTKESHIIYKYRCAEAHVKSIRCVDNNRLKLPDDTIAHSYYDPHYKYYVGKIVRPTGKFTDVDLPSFMCSRGIHFFRNVKEALDYLYYYQLGSLRIDVDYFLEQNQRAKMYKEDNKKCGTM